MFRSPLLLLIILYIYIFFYYSCFTTIIWRVARKLVLFNAFNFPIRLSRTFGWEKERDEFVCGWPGRLLVVCPGSFRVLVSDVIIPPPPLLSCDPKRLKFDWDTRGASRWFVAEVPLWFTLGYWLRFSAKEVACVVYIIGVIIFISVVVIGIIFYYHIIIIVMF